jgi:hypothetical protein
MAWNAICKRRVELRVPTFGMARRETAGGSQMPEDLRNAGSHDCLPRSSFQKAAAGAVIGAATPNIQTGF